ncbi:MAG: 2-polyprenyl-3-methyl-6-methoxy-1,4-benzoquinone monooxygenase [Gemmatimonadota bacterium]
MNLVDDLLGAADRALRTLAGAVSSGRPYPGEASREAELADEQRAEAAALMRVNHVGEICAQALYEAQAIGTSDPGIRAAFRTAALEEADHLAWTRRRIEELGGRTSLLNPLWYAGSFGIGLAASLLGDKVSLGFMAETERQVEQHLQGHLERLPPEDAASRAVVGQMEVDEARHGNTAMQLGGVELPWPARIAMKLAAKVMTTTAHRI